MKNIYKKDNIIINELKNVLHGRRIALISIYAPQEDNIEKRDFMDRLDGKIGELTTKGYYILCMGDFNISSIDLNGSENNSRYSFLLEEIIRKYELVNATGIDGYNLGLIRNTPLTRCNSAGIPFTR